MDLDLSTVKKLTKLERPVFRNFNRHSYETLQAREVANDSDNRAAVSAALALLNRNGLSVRLSPQRPDKPQLEGKAVGWDTLLSVVEILRKAEWEVDRARDQVTRAIQRRKEGKASVESMEFAWSVFKGRKTDLERAVTRFKRVLR